MELIGGKNDALGSTKGIKEKVGTLLLSQCRPLNGYTLVQLAPCPTRSANGILLNQTQYDASVNFVSDRIPVKVLCIGGEESDDYKHPYKVGDHVLLSAGVDGFIFFTKDSGRVCMIETHSVAMIIDDYTEGEI